MLADSGKCSRGGEGTRAVIAGNDESVPKGKRRPSPGAGLRGMITREKDPAMTEGRQAEVCRKPLDMGISSAYRGFVLISDSSFTLIAWNNRELRDANFDQ